MNTVEIIFWVAVGLIVYTYALYPLLLFAVTSATQLASNLMFLFRRRGRRSRAVTDEDLPTVSVVIAAYNEGATIAAKLNNCLQLNYPDEKLEILVGSDGSNDGTNEIVGSYADRGVGLAAYDERRGKPSVLNDTVPRATGDVVVLTDATTMMDPDAVRHLARHFANPKIGVVNGYLEYRLKDGATSREDLYWRYEEAVKFMEGRLGVVLGATGPMYAIRRRAYQPIPPDCIIDDFVIPMKISGSGYRAAYDAEARATEVPPPHVEDEAVRHARIGAGDFQALGMTWKLLNPLRGRLAWCYFSHKVLKWTTWFLLAAALLGNTALALAGRAPAIGWYRTLLAAQILFYLCAGVGALRPKVPVVGRLLAVPYYFVRMHAALFRGFLRWLGRSQAITWQRSGR
jgi:cellulose synthase/poly-beta-1,6-N-acetylglucosamine synthase-like glycosyltransferase